jgi:DNA-binding NarL/FixJ family response regulator
MTGRPRLMIVDDDDATRAALREALSMEGMDVVAVCADAEDALRVLDRTGPEVVLMDWRLPGMDGIEATRLVKERTPWVQVLLLTAYDGPVPRMGAEDAGAFAYLVKDSSVSFSKEIIRSAWERALDERDHTDTRPRREIGV